jgi:hypothetical protein
MKFNLKYTVSYMLMLASALLFTSCYEAEDPGPIQEIEREFSVADFDRLEMGDAFNIDVTQGNFFEVSVRGDRRNVDDLIVKREGSTLIIRYRDSGNRHHGTYIDITMPALLSANFSDASDSRISGFDDMQSFNLYLSGASISQLDMNVAQLDVTISGASRLDVWGEGESLNAALSGASLLKAFHFPVENAAIDASGASDVQVLVGSSLDARASGASVIVYRGDPAVTSHVSGASVVQKD